MPEDKAGFVVSPHALPTQSNIWSSLIDGCQWSLSCSYIFREESGGFYHFYPAGISYFLCLFVCDSKHNDYLQVHHAHLFCCVSEAHTDLPLFICKCVQLCVNFLSSLCFYSWLIVCVCVCVYVKEKHGERREMPGVCTICLKHMAGRKGHVECARGGEGEMLL